MSYPILPSTDNASELVAPLSQQPFVHLRVHSAYSLAQGANKIPDLAKWCQGFKMPACAITDTGNLFGALEFAKTMSDSGVQPIIGAALGVEAEHPEDEPDRLLLLAQDQRGYDNLMDLVSESHLATEAGYEPRLTRESLFGNPLRLTGLIAFSGALDSCTGRLLRNGMTDQAFDHLDRLRGLFEDRLYIELQRHGLEEQKRIEPTLLAFADRLSLPLVGTNAVHFKDPGFYEAHDVLMCIAQGATVATEKRKRVTREHWFKGPTEMAKVFADVPEAYINTSIIAQRCAARPVFRDPILPSYTEDPSLEGAELERQAREGLEERLAKMSNMTDHRANEYRDRLAFELKVINQMGFPGYFLIVADFIKWAKSNGIAVGPGRGSGAASLVAYSLTITDLDPIPFQLLFERFLNPERVSMPDFDIDFCQDRRDEVIEYVQQKYGRDKVAQIITFLKLQARAVLRDVGRVLQMPFGQVDQICKMVPNNPANPVTLKQAIDGEEQLQRQIKEDENVERLVTIGMQLEGLYRNASTHAAGVVIGDRPLTELVPLYQDPRSDMPATQFNMKWVEPAGLVKFDFLGLKTLTVIQEVENLVKDGGEFVDTRAIAFDDKKTFEMLAQANSVGVFQLESSGMRDVVRGLKPDQFEDIIALVSLYRPGPMENIPTYIARKHGKEAVEYLHPKLEPIVAETYGIMIYQEQVMQAAQVIGGYTLGGADLLRRAMGKKNAAEMSKQRATFLDGAAQNGISQKNAIDIFEQMEKFAGYGFNKAHAAAYALVAYQTAYLKAHFPVEFLAGSMTLDLHNTDKLAVFKQDLDRLGIQVLPPDVNQSQAKFSVEVFDDGSKALRYALGAIKNVGAAAMEHLVAERERNGPFQSIQDFVSRLDKEIINKRQLEHLVQAGAFDCLETNRALLLLNVDGMARYATAMAEERASSQVNLFDSVAGAGDAPTLRLFEAEEWPMVDKLNREFQSVGFYLSGHPMEAYGAALQRLKVRDIKQINSGLAKGRIKIAGVIVAKQERRSANGNRFAFVSISDATGLLEFAMFSELLALRREILEIGNSVLLDVEAIVDGDSTRVTAQTCELLDQVLSNQAIGLKIYMRDLDNIDIVRDLIQTEGRGHSPVHLVMELDEDREAELVLNERYKLTPAIRKALKSLSGVVVTDL